MMTFTHTMTADLGINPLMMIACFAVASLIITSSRLNEVYLEHKARI